MQSEPKSRPQNQSGEKNKITISQNTKRTYGKPSQKVATQLPKPN